MKTSRHRPIDLRDCAREREVQQEIENFLRALNSYPDHFASDPGLSFEQHLYNFAGNAQIYDTSGGRGRS
jgi:hypothetical protein